jgi:tetratricopeptide (TPR) repeat protein
MKIRVKNIQLLFIILISLFALPLVSFASVTDYKNSSKVVSEDENFNKIFREGRDLIDKEEWKQAAAKFNEIVCDCPENKGVDAAFYWLAFCYKKQNMFEQMDKTIDRLLSNFPSSSWADDARVMKYEQLSAFASTSARPAVRPIPKVIPLPATTEIPTIPTTNSNYDAAVASITSQTPLVRENEIKLAAFQSLLFADLGRAIELTGDILQTDFKANETLKSELVRTLRSFRLMREVFNSKTKIQLIPQLREVLLKSYQNESSNKVRLEMIYTIANINDETSINYITRLYYSEQNKDLKKAVIYSLGGLQFYSLDFTSGSTSPKTGNLDKLLDIISDEKDVDLRRFTFSNIQKFVEWSAKAGVIETLSRIYDSESNEEFKLEIIRSFTNAKQNQATTKLLDIAKNDKSDKVRIEAIRSLRTSSNPEVLKFLEDLIK